MRNAGPYTPPRQGESQLDGTWRHVNRAALAVERIRDRSMSSSQTVRETLEDLEERLDDLLAAVERAREIV